MRIKRILRGFNNRTRKNKGCYVSLSMLYVGPSLSRGHQTVAIMNLKIHCFKVTWLKTGMRMENLATYLGYVTSHLVVTCPSLINLVSDLLIVPSRSCVKHEMLWSRGTCLMKRTWTQNIYR